MPPERAPKGARAARHRRQRRPRYPGSADARSRAEPRRRRSGPATSRARPARTPGQRQAGRRRRASGGLEHHRALRSQVSRQPGTPGVLPRGRTPLRPSLQLARRPDSRRRALVRLRGGTPNGPQGRPLRRQPHSGQDPQRWALPSAVQDAGPAGQRLRRSHMGGVPRGHRRRRNRAQIRPERRARCAPRVHGDDHPSRSFPYRRGVGRRPRLGQHQVRAPMDRPQPPRERTGAPARARTPPPSLLPGGATAGHAAMARGSAARPGQTGQQAPRMQAVPAAPLRGRVPVVPASTSASRPPPAANHRQRRRGHVPPLRHAMPPVPSPPLCSLRRAQGRREQPTATPRPPRPTRGSTTGHPGDRPRRQPRRGRRRRPSDRGKRRGGPEARATRGRDSRAAGGAGQAN